MSQGCIQGTWHGPAMREPGVQRVYNKWCGQRGSQGQVSLCPGNSKDRKSSQFRTSETKDRRPSSVQPIGSGCQGSISAPITSWENLGKLLIFTVSQFPHL